MGPTLEDFYFAFIEGYLGPDKALKLRDKAYDWRLLDAWRYGVMHRNAKEESQQH